MEKKKEHRWVRLDQTFVDIEHQCPLDENWVKTLLKIWDEDKAQVPHLSVRGTDLYHIVDGQHQIAVRRACGEDGVWADVHTGLTFAEESDLFVALNTHKAKQPITLFLQCVKAERQPHLALAQALEHHGWRIAKSGGQNTFAAVATLRIVAMQGENGLDVAKQVIETITHAWGTNPQGAHARIVAGLGLLLRKRDLDYQRLIKVLREIDPETLRREAEAQAIKQSRRNKYANAMIARYNRNKRANRLDLFV
jgi:hypothetical protein